MSLLTGLVSYWTMDGAADGPETDVNGSNNLTDNSGNVGSAGGIINTCRYFVTTPGQFLTHASNSDLQVTGDFTFTAWVYFFALTTDSIVISKDIDSPVNSRDYTVVMISAGPLLRFYINGGAAGALVDSSATLSANTWTFVRVWFDSTAQTLNIQVNNGTVDSTNIGSSVPQVSSAPFEIGARAYSGFEQVMNGAVDEVGFWKRVLTSGEGTTLYNSGAGYPYSSFGGTVVADAFVCNVITHLRVTSNVGY
jgi:hypothetical protein